MGNPVGSRASEESDLMRVISVLCMSLGASIFLPAPYTHGNRYHLDRSVSIQGLGKELPFRRRFSSPEGEAMGRWRGRG
jgi:hypothetical protein